MQTRISRGSGRRIKSTIAFSFHSVSLFRCFLDGEASEHPQKLKVGEVIEETISLTTVLLFTPCV